MGEHAYKTDSHDYEQFDIPVTGITKGARDKELNKLKETLSKKGCRLVEYVEKGSTSKATFEGPRGSAIHGKIVQLKNGVLGIIGIVFLILIGVALFSGGREENIAPKNQSPVLRENETSNTHTTADIPDQNWYEGGNLHRKTIGDWRQATHHNRLATSADIIAKVVGELDKPKSLELEACLSTFASGADKTLMKQTVSEMAAACLIQLGYVSQ